MERLTGLVSYPSHFAMPMYAIATLAQDKLIAVNPSFLRMSGYSQGDVIGKTTTELSLWRSPEIYTAAIAQATKISSVDATSDKKISSYELDCQTHSGHSRTVLVSIERIVLRDQPCALIALKDITERKRLENEFISRHPVLGGRSGFHTPESIGLLQLCPVNWTA